MTEKTVIHVGPPPAPGTTPPPVRGKAQFFDGDRAVAQNVEIVYDDARQALVIELLPEPEVWPYDEIREIKDQADDALMILRLKSDPTARLMLTDQGDFLLIRSRARRLARSTSHVNRTRIGAWALAALASVAVIIFVLVPLMADQLAEYLPPEGEKALGDATFQQIRVALDETGFAGVRLCEAPAGRAALQKMEDRLTETMELSTPLTVHVLDHPMINAFALPGGYVVFFDGLLQEAGNAEEVAAVFAHEIGHVEARDPTRIALRSTGSIGVLGLLFGDFAGGALVLFLAEQIIRADYTQEAEAAADTFAHEALLNADLPPSAIATFFERLQDTHDHEHEEPGIVQHLQSHPALGDRVAAARAAEPEGAVFRPVLTQSEWADLQSICR